MNNFEEREDRAQFASLPPVVELEDVKVRQRVVALLELLDQAVAERQKLEQDEEKYKVELGTLQEATNRQGFRYGLLCFMSQPVKGRRTLDKMLLIENGCPADAINLSYKEGKPSIRRTFKRLGDE
jgi:hypothetical protein